MKIIKQLKLLSIFTICSFFITNYTIAQCDLTDLVIETSECDEANFVDVFVDFNFTGEGNQGFTILGNGVNYGNFEYTSLPVTLAGIEANCDTDYEFIIRDIQDPTCSVFTGLGTICCGMSCNLSIDSIQTTDCDDDNFLLSLFIDTDNEIDIFNVFLNDEFWGEAENLMSQINVGVMSSGQIGNNTVTICDATNSECCASITFLNPCECALENVTAEIIECSDTDSSYFAIIDFDHEATNDSFQMGYSDGGDNNFLGVFAYSDLPVTAGPIFWSDNEREILIVDTEDFFCFNTAFFGVVDDCDINCQIFNVFAESYDCEDGQYYIDVEFDTEDIEGNTFDVIVDDVYYGSFIYGESSYTVGPINQNCDEAPTLEIQDSNIESCKDFFNFDEPICCGILCEFNVFEATAVCNDADEVVITFQYENFSTNEQNQIFVTFGDQQYGPYTGPSGSEQISIQLLADGTYELEIYVAGNEACSAITSFVVDCPVEECSITNVFAEAQECEDGSFFVDIEFASTDVSESFEIRGNGQSYGLFEYGEDFYTVGPISGDCETLYEFVIIDQGIDDCTGVFVFDEPVCCSTCQYNEMSIGLIDCEDDTYTIIVDLDYEDENGTGFTINILGNNLSFPYSQLPVGLTGLPVYQEIEITITSNSDSECTISDISYLESCYDSVEDPIFSDITIQQRPGSINIQNASDHSYDFMLTNLQGQSIVKGNLYAQSNKEISTSNVNNGVYLFSIIANGKAETKKITIIN